MILFCPLIVKKKMDKFVKAELENGMIKIVTSNPKCIHALGAVYKT